MDGRRCLLSGPTGRAHVRRVAGAASREGCFRIPTRPPRMERASLGTISGVCVLLVRLWALRKAYQPEWRFGTLDADLWHRSGTSAHTVCFVRGRLAETACLNENKAGRDLPFKVLGPRSLSITEGRLQNVRIWLRTTIGKRSRGLEQVQRSCHRHNVQLDRGVNRARPARGYICEFSDSRHAREQDSVNDARALTSQKRIDDHSVHVRGRR